MAEEITEETLNLWRTKHARRKLKNRAVKSKGGKCIRCDYNKCVTALHFHHKNPLELSGDLLRPMLDVTDPSNDDPKYMRARVRNEIMPLLKELNPSIVKRFNEISDEVLGSTGWPTN
jgi:hypothetical protein